MPTTAPELAVAKNDVPSNRWAARIGLAAVVAMLVACFGVLIAATHGSTRPLPTDSPAAAVSADAPAR